MSGAPFADRSRKLPVRVEPLAARARLTLPPTPVPLTPLVGREREQPAAREHLPLPDARLLRLGEVANRVPSRR